MIYSFFVSIFVASVALAAPSFRLNGCDVSKATIPLPGNQTQLVAPTDTKPRFVGIGVGVQNYTCSSAGTYTSVGAVAELFDISCLPQSQFNKATDIANDVWNRTPKGVTAQQVMKGLSVIGSPFVLGQHFFVTNPVTGSGLSPKWDFTSASLKGKSNAFAIGARAGSVAVPPSTNVDWLSLNVVQGDLAKHIFRVETRNGQPPASVSVDSDYSPDCRLTLTRKCTPGSADISVKYVSQYWLYGGSF